MGSGKSSTPAPAPKPPPEQEPFDQTVDPEKRAAAQSEGQGYIEKADEVDRKKRSLGSGNQASSGLSIG